MRLPATLLLCAYHTKPFNRTIPTMYFQYWALKVEVKVKVGAYWLLVIGMCAPSSSHFASKNVAIQFRYPTDEKQPTPNTVVDPLRFHRNPTSLFPVSFDSRTQHTTMRAVIALTLIAAASAYCPNGCSGHGSCGANGE